MSQKYEPLIQEDLNVGTNPTWICCPSGGELRATQLGIHSFTRQGKSFSSTWAPGSIAAGGEADTTITVIGARTRDFVLASHDKILTNDLQITAHVSASDTIQVVIHNPGSAAVTVASGTLRVLDFINCDLLVTVAADVTTPSVGQDVTFTPTPSGGVSPYTYRWDFGDPLPRIPRDGLVAYWSMDEAEGNPRTNTLGDGGTDCDLNETSGTIASAAGEYSDCAVFTPAGIGSPYLESTGVVPVGRGIGTGYTVAGWVWRTDEADNGAILSKDLNGQQDFMVWGKTFYVINDAGTSTYLTLYSYNDPLATGGPAQFNAGQWDFFVGWVDFSVPEFGVQINGGNPKTKPLTGTFATPTTSKLRFGVRVYTLSDYFEGKVDAWVAYDRPLTADERLILFDGMSRLENPVYQYTTSDTYTATGTAIDSAGCTANDTVEITVSDLAVTWTVEESEAGAIGESWDYTFTPVVTGGTAPYTYAWNFGDGNPDDTNEIPTQVWDRGVYTNPDTISVTLTVTDDAAITAVYTAGVVVQFNE